MSDKEVLFPYPKIDSTVETILKEGSYLMYELKDKDIEYAKDKYGGTYKKYLSPLFVPEVINTGESSENMDNQLLLSIITEETPFYHLRSTISRDASDKYFVSQTRDLGLNDVPSPLHTNFWSVWFREAQADIQNQILLDVYNKLRYPFINENQYLSATLFPKMALDAFGHSGVKNSLIEFNYTEEDNLAVTSSKERSKYEVGCLDYINDIVEQKLKSTYAIMDYNPDQSGLLTDWAESLYLSGKLNWAQMQTEKTVFKLQDLKSELLRRKFAGSSTLYTLTLSAINRRGSFLGAVSAGRIQTEYSKFKDKRIIRLVNLPGVLTEIVDLSDTKPMDVYYSIPLANNEKYIPLGLTTPLFYTSATQTIQSLGVPFDPERFYISTSSSPTGETTDQYRSHFLRNNSSVITWNTPQGIISSKTRRSTYPKLDEKFKEDYRTLDGQYVDPKGETHDIIKLDMATPVLSSVTTSESVLDINADTLMYHRNSLQREEGDSYRFLRYTIAENNSVSLMDTSWISYLKNATERKSRIQDIVEYGAQVSHYVQLTHIQEAEYSFFGISYNYEDTVGILYDYNDGSFGTDMTGLTPRYAFIWFVTVYYDVATFKTTRVSHKLVSKVLLRIGAIEGRYTAEDMEKASVFKESESFIEFTKYNVGLSPFLYSDTSTVSTESMTSKLMTMRLGLYDNCTKFYDGLESSGFSKAYFMFSDSDSFESADIMQQKLDVDEFTGIDPKEASSPFSQSPSSNTKTFFYIVKRAYKHPIEENTYRHLWSEPIKVMQISSKFLDDLKKGNGSVYPDWYNLSYHMNPLLNFSEESASTLRHKKVISSYMEKHVESILDSTRTGASELTGLSNLACSRHTDFNRNDTGDLKDLLDNEGNLKHLTGFYLENRKPDATEIITTETPYTYLNREYVGVYGDNRAKDIYDVNDPSEGFSARRRSEVCYDDKKAKCLSFTEGDFYEEPVDPTKPLISYNIYTLDVLNTSKHLCVKSDPVLGLEEGKLYTNLEDSSTVFPYTYKDVEHNWSWNIPSTGVSIFLNTEFTEGCFRQLSTMENNKIVLVARTPMGKFTESSPKDSIDSEFSVHMIREEGKQEQSVDTWKFVFSYYPTGNRAFSFTMESRAYAVTELLGHNFRLAFGVNVSDGEDNNLKKTHIEQNLLIDYEKTPSLIHEIRKQADGSIAVYKADKLGRMHRNEAETTALVASLEQTKFQYRSDALYGVTRENFIPGYPVKFDKTASNNKLFGIHLFSEFEQVEASPIKGKSPIAFKQTHMFTGNVYDLRIYNAGFDAYAMQILNMGLVRDSFTRAPAAYKLGYSIYKDLGIFKRVSIAPSVPESVETIRIFNRSLWDSILVDMYPVSLAERTKGNPQYAFDSNNPQDDPDIFDAEGESKIVTQKLKEIAEVINETNPLASNSNQGTIVYNGQSYAIKNSDFISLVTTTLYPIDYSDHEFESFAHLHQKGDSLEFTTQSLDLESKDSPIVIPAHAIGNSLKYSSDLSLNFDVYPEADLSEYYSAGSNISLFYSEALKRPCVRLLDASKRDSNKNHILTSISIPKQDSITGGMPAYFDRFYLKNLQLTKDLGVFLDATSYYNEVRIPIAYKATNTSPVQIASRWDGMRLLKEGTYYFTVKYPVQLMPFSDYEFNTNPNKNFATLYASARFKIEVKGTPIAYDSKYNVQGSIPDSYLYPNLKTAVRTGRTQSISRDNRTFPHRLIDIDLYYMDCIGDAGRMSHDGETYTFDWKLLASNHSDKESIIKLTRDTLVNALVIDKGIPMFFSRNFTSPFFIAKTEKRRNGEVSYNPSSADDDLIEPIFIDVRYSTDTINNEKLTARNEDELDKLRVIAGKSYKLLFDYDGYLSEASYTDKLFREDIIDKETGKVIGETGEIKILDREKVNYTRLISILNEGQAHDFIYSGFGNWYAKSDSNINMNVSGFMTTNDSENPWMFGLDTISSKFYLGNPYSRASNRNYLLRINSEYRQDLNDLAYFPYICEDYPNGRTLSANYLTSIEAADSKTYNVPVIKTLNDFNENLLLSSLWQNKKLYILESIAKLQSNNSGLFTCLSTLEPNYKYNKSTGDVIQLCDVIKSSDYALYAYSASDRTIPGRNAGIKVTRRGVYSNNILRIQDFTRNAWTITYPGKYVSDNNWDGGIGKDVFEFKWHPTVSYIDANGAPSKKYDTISMHYQPTMKPMNATFEVALNLKCSDIANLKVTATFLSINNTDIDEVGSVILEPSSSSQETELKALENNGWYVFSAESKPTRMMNSIRYTFEYAGSRENVILQITKPILRTSSLKEHYNGLANAAYNDNQPVLANSEIYFVSHSAVLFKNKLTGCIIPVRFKNKVSQRTDLSSTSAESVRSYAVSGLNEMSKFISDCLLAPKNDSVKMQPLYRPWIRRVRYWESYESDDQDIGKDGTIHNAVIKNRVVFYKYKTEVNVTTGVKSLEELKINSTDIFKAENKVDERGNIIYAFDYDDSSSKIRINSLEINGSSDALNEYGTNLRIHMDDPIVFEDERFSLMSNCFHPEKFIKDLSSTVAVTNIQLLGPVPMEGDRPKPGAYESILYEYEYLPIIYDESSQHISLNLMVHITN